MRKTKTARRVLMLLGSYDHRTHGGIARYSREAGWHLDVSVLKTFQLPSRWEGDGVITSLNANRRLESFVRKTRLPVVDLSTWREDLDLPRVAGDHDRTGKLAADYFLGLGFCNFAWFAMEANPVGRARGRAFTAALAERGHRVRSLSGGLGDRESWRRLLARLEKPCAVFTKSDADSAWLCSIALEGGLRVPEDLAILGVDDNPLICETQAIPLSSIHHDLEEIGYRGARLLDRLMVGRITGTPQERLFSGGLSVRKSTEILAVSDPRVRGAVEFLKENLRRSIGTADVVDHVGGSRRSLELKFKSELGVSIHSMLVRLRVEKARELLADNERVEDVSARTGFSNTPHFSRTFKRYSGMTPSRYRQQAVAKL